ncbi:MAG: cytochrome c oxidase assembly factor Coa1 family protein [Planctomycetaceae bacterium]
MRALTRFVVMLAGTAALVGCRPLSQHPVAVMAVEELGRNARAAEVLGQPVTCGPAFRGVANETDGIAALSFDVKGPKNSGVVAVDGKKTKGTWGVTRLELRPDGGGSPLALTADIETDTPKFDPSAAPKNATPSVPPPGDIEIALPPGPPGS